MKKQRKGEQVEISVKRLVTDEELDGVSGGIDPNRKLLSAPYDDRTGSTYTASGDPSK